jgi:hypothetical protein
MPEVETSQDERVLAMSKHVSTLLGLKGFNLKAAKNKTALSVLSLKSCPVYKHKFSHIARDYMPVHVVVTSATLPEIADERTSWVVTSEILSQNLPTASKSIWEIHTGVKTGKKVAVKKTTSSTKRSAVVTQSNAISGYFSKSQSKTTVQQEVVSEEEIVEVVSTSPRKKRRIQESDSDE